MTNCTGVQALSDFIAAGFTPDPWYGDIIKGFGSFDITEFEIIPLTGTVGDDAYFLDVSGRWIQAEANMSLYPEQAMVINRRGTGTTATAARKETTVPNIVKCKNGHNMEKTHGKCHTCVFLWGVFADG